MQDLSQLLTPQSFPSALERVRRSFAQQPDCQTCGASAIRHGLLLGGLTIPTSALEAILGIRANEGTAPDTMRACLTHLGFEVRLVRRGRRRTSAFLDGLRSAFEQGAFLLPCIYKAEHWVCVGDWRDGRVGVIDSFFDGRGGPNVWTSPRLGFFNLSPDEFDDLDWDHHVLLVTPGTWHSQYRAWLAARESLMRMSPARNLSLVQAIRLGAHQHLDDAESPYHRLELYLARGTSVSVAAHDPGGDAVGVESLGEAVVVRRLGGLLNGQSVPELVMRAGVMCAGQLA